MSGDQLDLDEVEDLCAIVRDEEQRTWHERQDALWQLLDVGGTVPALVAEVRQLRARFRLCDGCDATLARCNEHIEAGAIKCCPDCKHADAA